jgi:hypothetical protein
LRDPSGRAVSSSRITSLERSEVFVFGSNAAGKHGGGAARMAMDRFGAVYGEGHGLHGQSYAIDTMSGLDVIESGVRAFLGVAHDHPELTFLVTEIGTGIAGHQPDQIAPLFREAPENVALPSAFVRIELDEYRSAWTAELLQWAVDFLSLDAELNSPNLVLRPDWREAEPLWDEHDINRTVARLRDVLGDPQGTEVLGRYVYSGSPPDWHFRRLLVRALFELRQDEEALTVARELVDEQAFCQMGGDWWEIQIWNLAEGRIAAGRGRLRKALDHFSAALWGAGGVGNAGWDPDLALCGLCETAFLDTSWLAGDDPARSWSRWPGRPVERDMLARLALSVAKRVTPWRGTWYDAAVEQRLLDLAGPGFVQW